IEQIFQGEHRSVIIKYVPLYHKILQCLTRGPSLQHVMILNFVAALLYIDADEGPTQKKALSIHAQNMIRASGCLSAMCDLFVACMMVMVIIIKYPDIYGISLINCNNLNNFTEKHQETWRALCRSLAEVCRGSVINQNFCAHLVPLVCLYIKCHLD
ncbi:uncharacterized protein LOC119830550, partial [Zerene cesonia]|uniref:uncharacterized protein LOC119830550 n=1 Tax=Zerene cesonia TaxID=33412 RepID=UPI0018E4F41A